jgi:hypothetical protein
MKKLNIYLLLFIFVLSRSVLNALELDTSPLNSSLQSRLDIGYSTGQFIGIDQGYAEAALLAPIYLKNSSLSLVDFRLYRFDNSKWGLSSGFSFRNKIKNDHIVGANLYYDSLQGKFNKIFNRLGLGLEWLGECLDFRFNAYIPLGLQEYSSKKYIYKDYIGGYSAICRENQFSISKGFDAEIGSRFWCCANFTAYVAIGPYFYSCKQESSYFGGHARIEVHYNSIISFQIRSSYDPLNQSRIQGQIQISFPFDIFSKKLNNFCENLILQPIRRNGVIFTKGCCDYKWNW